ncbi:MAG: hypothetical protein K2N63_15010 [Lachnospiraceae bacterium]|nr:hypothetical protein [Lachnospiraceae bacterium]
MKNLKKVFMTLHLLALLAVPVVGSTLPKEPVMPEPGISVCSLNPDSSHSIVEDDDLEIHE